MNLVDALRIVINSVHIDTEVSEKRREPKIVWNRLAAYAKEIQKNKTNYLFLLPMYVLFVVFYMIPAIRGVSMSFYSYANYGKSRTFVGLANYIDQFRNPVFWKALQNTFMLAAVVVPGSLVVSLCIALTVFDFHPRLQTWIRSAFYLPLVIGGITLTLTWQYIFNPVFGLANYVLGLFGLDNIVWLGDPNWALWAIIIIIFSFSLGIPTIMFLAGLGAIPETYYEAAYLDGANEWKRILLITLPLLKPTMVYLTVTSTIGAFQVFVVVQILTSGGPNHASELLMHLLYTKAFMYGDYGGASVIGIVLLAICTVIAAVQYRLMSSNLEY